MLQLKRHGVCIALHCTLHIFIADCTYYPFSQEMISFWTLFNSHNRKKYGLQPKQIQSNISPNLMEVSCGAGMEIPIEMKYEKQSKQILSNFSPNLMVTVSHPPALRRFPDTLWRKKTPGSTSKSEFRCMGGLINRFLPVWCPISHSIWPLLFPHQLSGGCGTRLSIRRQDPNIYSDTETRALSRSDLSLLSASDKLRYTFCPAECIRYIAIYFVLPSDCDIWPAD